MAFEADIARAKSNFWDLMRNNYYRTLFLHRFYNYVKFFKPLLVIDKTFSLPSNPQPIGFRENLLVKRPKFFYCTYSLGITETS